MSGSERLTAADAVNYDSAVESGAGHGWLAGLHPVNQMSVDEALLPDARSLLRLASQAVEQQLTVAAGDITINYLRNRVAEKARN